MTPAPTLAPRVSLSRWRGTPADAVRIDGEMVGTVWPDRDGGWRWARIKHLGLGSEDTGRTKTKDGALKALRKSYEKET